MRSTPPTAITPSSAAGYPTKASSGLFPAAATTMIFASKACFIDLTSSGVDEPLLDMLMTSACWAMAISIPLAKSSGWPLLSAPDDLMGKIRAAGAIPLAPLLPAWPCAAIKPAIPVPWLFSSLQPSPGSPGIAETPRSRLVRRSGCGSTPVSSTATTTPAPVLTAFASPESR